MRRPHDVPLSKQALDVLRSVWDLSDGDGLVFASNPRHFEKVRWFAQYWNRSLTDAHIDPRIIGPGL